MFWDTFADDASTATGVSAVLSRETFTLADILREDDVLSEFGASNALVAFVVKHITDVLALALAEPKTEEEARFAFFSTEMLRFGHAPVSDALVTHASLLLDYLKKVEEGFLHVTPAENFARIVSKLLETNKIAPTLVPIDALLMHLYNGSILTVLQNLIFACTSEFETAPGANCRLVRQLDGKKAIWLAEQKLPEKLCRLLFAARSDTREHAVEALEKLTLFAKPDDAVSSQLIAAAAPLFVANGNLIEGAKGAELLILKYPSMASVRRKKKECVYLNKKKKQALNSFVVSVCQASLAHGAGLRLQLAGARLLCAQSTSSSSFENFLFLPLFVERMIQREQATLLAVAVTECVHSVLTHHRELGEYVKINVFSLLERAFLRVRAKKDNKAVAVSLFFHVCLLCRSVGR